MNLRKQILTANECYKYNKPIKVKGICVHSTGANNPNLKRYVGPDDGVLGKNPNNNHWNQFRPDGRQVCVHAFIGKLADGSIATYQTLPWTIESWHGGSGAKGRVNDTHIGFEICEDGLTDADYFNAVYQEAAELCAYLCGEFNLDPLADGVLICHSEGYKRGIATNHADVTHWFPRHGRSMDMFRRAVKALMGKDGLPPTPAAKYHKVQIGAFPQKSNADTLAAKLKAAGFADAYVTPISADKLYRVQVGAFGICENADSLAAKLKAAGFDAFVKYE